MLRVRVPCAGICHSRYSESKVSRLNDSLCLQSISHLYYTRRIKYRTMVHCVATGDGSSQLSQRNQLPKEVNPSSQFLQLMDAFVISSLPPGFVEGFSNSRVPSLQRRYPLSLLLRTHPPPSRLRLISSFCDYRAISFLSINSHANTRPLS